MVITSGAKLWGDNALVPPPVQMKVLGRMALPWMPIYWGDYFRKTLHLSTEEHGAYLLLIGAYWERGKALPDDDIFFAQVTKLTKKKWKMVRPKISEFFDISEGLWTHHRVEKQLLDSCGRIATASANAYARWGTPHMLPTTTSIPIEERKKVTNGFLVGGRKGKVEMTPENRLATFQAWLAKEMGSGGWIVVGHANDPYCPEYAEAVKFCKRFAKERGKGWPHQWPQA